MGWFILAHLFEAILGLIGMGHRPENDKDLEILILRHRLKIVARKQNKPFKPTHIEKLILAVLTHKIKQLTHRSTEQRREIVRIFQPATVPIFPLFFGGVNSLSFSWLSQAWQQIFEGSSIVDLWVSLD